MQIYIINIRPLHSSNENPRNKQFVQVFSCFHHIHVVGFVYFFDMKVTREITEYHEKDGTINQTFIDGFAPYLSGKNVFH